MVSRESLSSQDGNCSTLIPPSSTVSRILQAKHIYLDFREPQLDESAPWSSWAEITVAAKRVPRSPPPSNVDIKTPNSPLPAASWTSYDSVGNFQDWSYEAAIQRLREPQYVFSQDRCVSPPMSSPPLPAQNPPDRSEMSSPEPEPHFWTGLLQSSRPSSVKSYGSSRNSSLHGSPAMDASYQSPIFSIENEKHGSAEAGKSPRGLLPAPIDWTATQSRNTVNKEFSFDCEICGEFLKASRRRDWQ